MYDQTSILPICSKFQRNTNEAPFVEIIAAKTSGGTGGRSVRARSISVTRRCSWRVSAERRKRWAARPCEAFYLEILGLRTSRQEDRCGSSKEQGTAAAAGVEAAAFERVTCIACAPTGLGRCTRMHKGLKPRSMSETSHLPTDVESSSQDPSLHYSPAGLCCVSPHLPVPSSSPLRWWSTIRYQRRGPLFVLLRKSQRNTLRTLVSAPARHDHLRITSNLLTLLLLDSSAE